MRAPQSTDSSSITPSRVILGLSAVLLAISIVQLFQNPLSAWSIRPSVTCEQGDVVHQTGVISANRVNIRAQPTVFSEVVTQVNEDHPIVVVCQFGAWSQIKEPNLEGPTWVSSGLMLLDANQPLSTGAKIGMIASLLFSLGGLAPAHFRPAIIDRGTRWLMQTGDLPDYAKPLISNPKGGSSNP